MSAIDRPFEVLRKKRFSEARVSAGGRLMIEYIAQPMRTASSQQLDQKAARIAAQGAFERSIMNNRFCFGSIPRAAGCGQCKLSKTPTSASADNLAFCTLHLLHLGHSLPIREKMEVVR
jgi:hypothetical protein